MSKLIIATFLIAVSASSVYGRPQSSQLEGRIIGGVERNIRDIPFQVSLFTTKKHFCGGALISPEWVLTAAHCMGKMGKYQIRMNSSEAFAGGTAIDVVKDYVHPNFDRSISFDYDVALVRIKKINSDGIRFARFPKCTEKKSRPGDMIEVSGWGINRITDYEKSQKLQSVRVPIVDHKECNEIYKEDGEITPRMMCAGLVKDGGKDACQGDSGGPATCKGNLCGVVSFGYGCANPNEPGIYTDLSDPEIGDWIKKVSGIDSCVKSRKLAT